MPARRATPARTQLLFTPALAQQFRNLPGVRAATMSDIPLVSDGGYVTRVLLPGALKQDGPGGSSTYYGTVGPAFFETMQGATWRERPWSRSSKEILSGPESDRAAVHIG